MIVIFALIICYVRYADIWPIRHLRHTTFFVNQWHQKGLSCALKALPPRSESHHVGTWFVHSDSSCIQGLGWPWSVRRRNTWHTVVFCWSCTSTLSHLTRARWTCPHRSSLHFNHCATDYLTQVSHRRKNTAPTMTDSLWQGTCGAFHETLWHTLRS